ncbi:leucine-rich repeat protein [Carnobacterium maltaromaticum]|uniref:leucine-rich repeat protein n=1 Tax=Carnobacterium maltaromaticum TaxID=2751 RepID=UPI00295E80ED|nr:leucine-rich repeat protein [Carnobacterium maltaromaticum]
MGVGTSTATTEDGFIFPVVTIGYDALANKELTSVIIPSSVVSIEWGAFRNNKLTSIKIPDSVIKIEGAAFQNNQLSSISISENIESIGELGFENNLLSELVIPNSLRSIEWAVFRNNKLASITFPNNLITIKGYAFSFNNLTTIMIPDSLETIGDGAFNSNQLKNITIPSSVISIGNSTFENNQLTSALILDGLVSIGKYAFGNNRLENIIIPNSVKHIESSVFAGNPLIYLRVASEYLEELKTNITTNNSLAGVSNRTIIMPEEGFVYSEDSTTITDIGKYIELKVDGVGYQIKKLGQHSPEWEQIKYDWFKNQESLNDNKNPLIIENVSEIDSGDYHVVIGEESGQIKLPDISVNILRWGIPPINPTDPSPITPDYSNPNLDVLSIRYVSSLDFGEIFVSDIEKTAISKPSKDSKGQDIPNMITVEDQRKESERDKWDLMVRQEELLPGIKIFMSPYVAEVNERLFNISISESFIVNNTNQLFASGGGKETPMHIVSMGMHQPENTGVELQLPKNISVGDYHTILIWNISMGI